MSMSNQGHTTSLRTGRAMTHGQCSEGGGGGWVVCLFAEGLQVRVRSRPVRPRDLSLMDPRCQQVAACLPADGPWLLQGPAAGCSCSPPPCLPISAPAGPDNSIWRPHGSSSNAITADKLGYYPYRVAASAVRPSPQIGS